MDDAEKKVEGATPASQPPLSAAEGGGGDPASQILDDEIIDVPAQTAVRIAPDVVRSVWNEGPGDVELVMASVKVDDPRADGIIVQDFWPE